MSYAGKIEELIAERDALRQRVNELAEQLTSAELTIASLIADMNRREAAPKPGEPT